MTCDTYATAEEQSCIGVGPRHVCTKSFETDRGGAFEHAPGSGGPTGCREAYLTVMGDDGFLAGVLILLHTVRKYAYVDRDFVVIVSTAVTQPIIERLQEECVRVIQVDPFYQNELAQQLVAKSARYKSGYWVIKMFVWRLEEYSKLVYIDGDVYFRQSADELFCSPVSPKVPIGVTPRSSQDESAGFNAGMFVYQPNRATYEGIMQKFLSLDQDSMLATSEQDFLNAYFKGRYNLIPIDYVMKHRRMVKESKSWDLRRVHGYHMNGNPKPWSPLWRSACAYPDGHGQFIDQYESFFVEWWEYYYDYVQKAMPASHADFRLEAADDPTGVFAKWDPAKGCDQ
uniref:Hexosyltransferase n=1 Tax=Pyramimonas obovata TaxID=1411642 RepID=A0A7S0WQN2_9CHLO